MKRRDDPRNDPGWWTLLVVLVMTLGAALLGRRAGGDDAPLAWLAALSWSAAWLAMARFRWFAVRWWKTWLGILVAAWLLTVLGNRALAIVGMSAGLIFAWDSRGSLRLLSSRRRALIFGMGLVAAVASLGLGWSVPDGKTGDIIVMARSGLQIFWLNALLALLFGMRLHFLRIRPKLFVTGVLVGVVPFMLLMVFGSLLLYGTLGGSRANRTRDVLAIWADTFAQGDVPAAFDKAPSVWVELDAGEGLAWGAELVAAARAGRRGETRNDDDEDDAVVAAERPLVVHQERDGQVRFTSDSDEPWLPTVVAAADTTIWLSRGPEVWLVRLQDPAAGQARVDALELTPHAMGFLARYLRVDVEVKRGEQDDAPDVEARVPLIGLHDPPTGDDDPGWWSTPRYFGAALIPAPDLRDRFLAEEYLLATVKTSFADLAREFVSRDNFFNMGLIVLLGVLAMMLAVAGMVALMFSLRITGGIVGAVKTLHRGTRRLALGDLETRIEIPNEDEFGDLADSFNEMAVAVKQGREDALARERLMQEMDTAREIQQRLLPHEQPLLRGWDITGVSIPSLQVGGDYFDFTSPGNEQLGIAIGDVSGKGVPAALLMSNLQACLKGQVLHPSPVSDTVTRMNDLLSESTDPHMFATFFYCELDGPTGHFDCTNAGHDPALVVRRDGTVEWLSSGGLILGMFGDQTYEQVAIDLEPGDVMVLYTDGITEAGAPLILPGQEPPEMADDADDDHFGEERLAEVVAAARERTALGIREAVLAAVKAHLAGEPQGDDITLVVLKRGEEMIP